jgi:hypothetical protein
MTRTGSASVNPMIITTSSPKPGRSRVKSDAPAAVAFADESPAADSSLAGSVRWSPWQSLLESGRFIRFQRRLDR